MQGQITYLHNGPRIGDEIVKQQVEYKDPGRQGENVIWDFSNLESINEEYILAYTEPYLIDNNFYILGKDTVQSGDVLKGELIIGTEHYTMYYYRIINDKLYVTGHENPTTLLQYTKPLLTNHYPLNYNDRFSESYKSEGLYSSRIPFRTEGEVQIQADAYGMMILPGGDTLKHVLRTKTIQSILHDKTDPTILENYKWYSKGYRYPVFETVRTHRNTDTEQANKFETAFFFPPQDHFYLDNDKDNLAILDSLWNIGQNLPEDIMDPTQPDGKLPMTYNFYPNPVADYLTIEYYLEQVTPVTITIYSLEGKLVKTVNHAKQNTGLQTEIIDCSSLNKGSYILNIQTNSNKPTSNKIIKL